MQNTSHTDEPEATILVKEPEHDGVHAHDDYSQNKPMKELAYSLIGIVLLLAIISLIVVSAFLRPAGEHIEPEPLAEDVVVEESVAETTAPVAEATSTVTATDTVEGAADAPVMDTVEAGVTDAATTVEDAATSTVATTESAVTEAATATGSAIADGVDAVATTADSAVNTASEAASDVAAATDKTVDGVAEAAKE